MCSPWVATTSAWQSFAKLSYSAIDNVLTNLLPAGLQDFFRVLNVSNATTTVNKLLERSPDENQVRVSLALVNRLNKHLEAVSHLSLLAVACTSRRRNAFSCKSCFTMHWTDRCDIPVSREISRGDLLEPRWPSWLQISSSTTAMLSGVRTDRCRLVPLFQLPTEPRIRPLSWHSVFPLFQEPEELSTSFFWWRPLIEVKTSSF